MAPGRIVECLDVVGHVCSRQLSGLVDAFFDTLLLQTCEEGFSDRVVPAVSFSAHARLESIRSTEAPPVIAAILSPNDLVQLGALVTREQHRALRSLSERTHVPVSVYVRQAVAELLKKTNREEKQP